MNIHTYKKPIEKLTDRKLTDTHATEEYGTGQILWEYGASWTNRLFCSLTVRGSRLYRRLSTQDHQLFIVEYSITGSKIILKYGAVDLHRFQAKIS